MLISRALITSFYLTVIFPFGLSEVIRGYIDSAETWLFLARFCFLSEAGKFEYQVWYPVEYGPQRLLLYYDEPDQWSAVYKTKTTCYEKIRVLSVDNGQFINLTLLYHDDAGCRIQRIYGKSYFNCTGSRKFRSARDRWWYIALSNCHSKVGLQLHYKFIMTNAARSFWFKHFSVDKFYILPTNIIFLIAYLVLMLIAITFSVKLIKKHLFHSTYKLFVISICYKFFSLFMLCIADGQFAVDGMGYPLLKILGLGCGAISEFVFLLLSLLIAKGYTITRGRLRLVSSIKLAVFLIFYFINYAAILVYQQLYFDPGMVLYLYESPAGYAMIALRLAAYFWFGYAVLVTLQHYKEKFRFYSVYFFCYTLWFLAGPLMIIFATIYIPKWMRAKVMNSVDQIIAVLAHTGFLILTRPSEANKRFPYHVKTSQIDVMKTSADGTNGDNSIDSFHHQAFPVNDPANRYHVPNYDDLFVVQRPLEMANLDQNPGYRERQQQNSLDDFVRSHSVRNNINGQVPVSNGTSNGTVSTIYQPEPTNPNYKGRPPPYNEHL